jgi:predicted nucleic acid-binding protein
MALILDTNAVSAFADGDIALHRVIEADADLALPTVVLGEYMFGIRDSRFRSRYESWLRAHLPVFLVLPVGLETAERYAAIRSELKAAGRPIPSNDLWIAALAREYGFALVSRDEHFQAVRGLHLIMW